MSDAIGNVCIFLQGWRFYERGNPMRVRIKNRKARYWVAFLALGFMGGNAYVFQYLRYVFYDQMMGILQCTNMQLGMLTTSDAMFAMVFAIPGAYLADKFDAKKVLVFCISMASVCTFIHGIFITSYPVAFIMWGMNSACLCPYWAALVKYINSMDGEENAGASFGIYYMFNGLAGALGNVIPLWVSRYFGYQGAVITVGVITSLSAFFITLFLDSEEEKRMQGEILVGDEPIRLRHLKYVLKWPGLYILALAVFATYTVYSNVSYFNPYLIDVVGIDPSSSSGYSIIRSYLAMIVAPLGGLMADRVLKSSAKWYMLAFGVIAALFLVPLAFTPETNADFIIIYSLMPALVIMALYSVTYSIIRELHIPATVMGTAVGIASASINISDGFIPALFGHWIDNGGRTGYTYVFLFLSGICVLGIFVGIWARAHDKKCKAGLRELKLDA